MKLVILIPAFNEEKNLGDVLRSLPTQLDGITSIVPLVVDDGSSDGTVQTAKDAGAIVVSHGRNRGLGNAFNTGLIKAMEIGAQVLVTMDADGQFDPGDIPALISPILHEQADFVPGDRFTSEDGVLNHPEFMSAVKFWGNQRMSALISSLTKQRFADVSCGFRAYSKEAMLKLNLSGQFTYTQESFLDLANKDLVIKPLPVKVKYFQSRKSRIAGNIIKYAIQTTKIIVRAYRDYNPLRFFGVLGLIPFVGSVLSGLFMMLHYLKTMSFSPYKFIGFGGIYLFSLCIIFWIIGLLSDMFVRIRLNQEKLLYYQKKARYYDE